MCVMTSTYKAMGKIVLYCHEMSWRVYDQDVAKPEALTSCPILVLQRREKHLNEREARNQYPVESYTHKHKCKLKKKEKTTERQSKTTL